MPRCARSDRSEKKAARARAIPSGVGDPEDHPSSSSFSLPRARTPHGFPLSYSPLDLASPGCLDGAGASSLPVRRSDRGGRGFGGAVSRRSRPARPSIPTGERVRERGSGEAVHSDGERVRERGSGEAVHSDGRPFRRERGVVPRERSSHHAPGWLPSDLDAEGDTGKGRSIGHAGGRCSRAHASRRPSI